ncbi:hypothetical protein GN956_G24184 [Arapaima gigas]
MRAQWSSGTGSGRLGCGGVRGALVLLVHLLAVQTQDTRLALVGTDVLLPCSCPEESKSFLVWQTMDNKVVDKHCPGTDKQDVHGSFRDRTQLFYPAEKHNCSMLLRGVSVKDESNYSCFYKTEQIKKLDVELLVAAQYSIQVEVNSGEAAQGPRSDVYRCHATGGYPAGQILWLLDNVTVTSGPPTEQQNEDGLYNLSSTVTVRVPEGSVLRCVVRNPRLEGSVHAEVGHCRITTTVTVTHTAVGRGESVSPTLETTQPWVAVGGVMIILSMLLLAFVTLSYRRHRLRRRVRLVFSGW